ncbi:MAG: NTP transferase domain-containing protein, partial [Candidatus Mucispirillum faecigallinarum]|nr:NTP transferase domain-containing protein [Candidatus Mucispirillum faecigallinarum]
MDISYAVLSGGQAKRFGSDKTKALYKGKPLYLYGIETGLSLSSDVMLISKDSSKYQPYLKNVQYLQDDLGEICPMSGLIKVGMSAKYDDIFILSADAPLIEKDFVKFLYSSFNNCDGVIPVINGKSYTLMGFYKRKVLLNMLDDYNNKNFKIIKSLE